MRQAIQTMGRALFNPVLWVTFGTPLAVLAALTLARADLVTLPSTGGPATSGLETDIKSPHTQAILEYSLQIVTVVLAFIFWATSLLRSGGVVEFCKACHAGRRNAPKNTAHDKITTKIGIYVVAAVIISLVCIRLFFVAGHLDIIRLYEASRPVPQPAYFGWFFTLWHSVDGPPWDSPLTWMRGVIFLHALFQAKYEEWLTAVGWST
jgi:hypothetical protein